MALLGSSVDPRLFMQDYSGFTRAAEIQAQGMQNLGRAVGGAIEQVGDYFKQQGEKKKLIKKSDVQIDAALKLFPDLAPTLQNARDQIKDENVPLDDRAAIAESVAKLIDLGVGKMRNASNLLMQQQRFGLEQQYKAAQLGLKERQVAATEFGARQAAAPTFDLQKATITSPDGETFEMDIPYDKKKGMFFDPDAGKYIKDINKWGFGEPSYVEGEAMPTPTSQIAPSGQINQSALSSPLRQYAGSFEEYGNKYGVDPALLAAIAEHETGGGKSSAFRNKNNAMGVSNASGPIKMESVEASIEKMASLLGRGINDGKGPYANAKSIEDIGRKYAPIGAGNDPRNLNQFWTRGVRSKYEKLATPKQIDNAVSMSQTAIGTPDEQAKVAQLIQEGQSMQTAQMIPQGAMGTEPSISTQQPQQAQPQLRPRAGFVPVKPKGEIKKVDIVTGPTAQALNLDPRGTYEVSRENGNITGVQTITAAPTIGETTKAEASKAELEKAKAAKDISIKTISEFVNDKGEPTEALQSAVGYGEALATGIAQYAPILGTQSGKTRSDQQRLARLVEGSVLDAASLLKPVSNTDLKMLIQNRPQITDPVETWTEYFREIRSILKNPNNYIDSVEPEKPQTATQKLRGKLQGQ